MKLVIRTFQVNKDYASHFERGQAYSAGQYVKSAKKLDVIYPGKFIQVDDGKADSHWPKDIPFVVDPTDRRTHSVVFVTARQYNVMQNGEVVKQKRPLDEALRVCRMLNAAIERKGFKLSGTATVVDEEEATEEVVEETDEETKDEESDKETKGEESEESDEEEEEEEVVVKKPLKKKKKGKKAKKVVDDEE